MHRGGRIDAEELLKQTINGPLAAMAKLPEHLAKMRSFSVSDVPEIVDRLIRANPGRRPSVRAVFSELKEIPA